MPGEHGAELHAVLAKLTKEMNEEFAAKEKWKSETRHGHFLTLRPYLTQEAREKIQNTKQQRRLK